jgi:hypothetical protein
MALGHAECQVLGGVASAAHATADWHAPSWAGYLVATAYNLVRMARLLAQPVAA